jgi:hypothetical protein
VEAFGPRDDVIALLQKSVAEGGLRIVQKKAANQ